jgi:hypothetical protein
MKQGDTKAIPTPDDIRVKFEAQQDKRVVALRARCIAAIEGMTNSSSMAAEITLAQGETADVKDRVTEQLREAQWQVQHEKRRDLTGGRPKFTEVLVVTASILP